MSALGRGRGRGRGNTLPAWMTHGDADGGVGTGNIGGGPPDRDNMREGRGREGGGYDRDERGGIGRDNIIETEDMTIVEIWIGDIVIHIAIESLKIVHQEMAINLRDRVIRG